MAAWRRRCRDEAPAGFRSSASQRPGPVVSRALRGAARVGTVRVETVPAGTIIRTHDGCVRAEALVHGLEPEDLLEAVSSGRAEIVLHATVGASHTVGETKRK